MAPTRLVTDLKANDGSSMFAARRRAYEMDTFIGGTVGKLYFEGMNCCTHALSSTQYTINVMAVLFVYEPCLYVMPYYNRMFLLQLG